MSEQTVDHCEKLHDALVKMQVILSFDEIRVSFPVVSDAAYLLWPRFGAEHVHALCKRGDARARSRTIVILAARNGHKG